MAYSRHRAVAALTAALLTIVPQTIHAGLESLLTQKNPPSQTQNRASVQDYRALEKLALQIKDESADNGKINLGFKEVIQNIFKRYGADDRFRYGGQNISVEERGKMIALNYSASNYHVTILAYPTGQFSGYAINDKGGIDLFGLPK